MSDTHLAEHDPTPSRRQRAREAGEVARSGLLVTAIVALAGFTTLRYGISYVAEWFSQFGQTQLSEIQITTLNGNASLSSATTVTELTDQIRTVLLSGLWMLAPWMLLLMVFALLVNLGQVGWLFLPQRVVPQSDRLLRAGWMADSIGRTGRAAFSLVQLIALGSIGLFSIWCRRVQLLELWGPDILSSMPRLAQFIIDTGLHVSLALLVCGLGDYAYRWWRHEQSLRMTTAELREEMQQTERRGRAQPRVTYDRLQEVESSVARSHV